MKKAFKQVIFFALLVVVFAACKKEETKVTYDSATAPVLTASNYTNPLVLLRANRDEPAITFSWTNPDYRFSTGISSQDVSYTLQLDSVGKNYSSDKLKEQVISKDLGLTLSVAELNLLLALFQEDVAQSVEIRIKASLANSALELYSNPIALNITPYLDVAVPLSFTGNLFIIGSATQGGWNNPVPAVTQQFTQTSSTTWEIVVDLAGSNEFLVLPNNGSWDNKYAAKASNLPDPNTGGEFGYNGGNPDFNNNFPGPSATGTYKIVFNFKTGKYTITLQ